MKLKRAIWYIVPPVVVIGAIYIINKSKTKKLQEGVSNSPLLEPAAVKTTTQALNLFPLKKGSKNDKVGELQRILGVSVDNNFGSQTEAALKAFSGKITVDSQSELNALATKKTADQNLSTSVDKAKQLLTQFQAGGVSIYTKVDTLAYGYIEDYAGAINYNNKNLNMPKNKTYGSSDYKLIGYTKSGNLEMQVTRGDFAGAYVINPNNITLV